MAGETEYRLVDMGRGTKGGSMDATFRAPALRPPRPNRVRVHARLPASAAKRAKPCGAALHVACHRGPRGVRGDFPPRERMQRTKEGVPCGVASFAAGGHSPRCQKKESVLSHESRQRGVEPAAKRAAQASESAGGRPRSGRAAALSERAAAKPQTATLRHQS